MDGGCSILWGRVFGINTGKFDTGATVRPFSGTACCIIDVGWLKGG